MTNDKIAVQQTLTRIQVCKRALTNIQYNHAGSVEVSAAIDAMRNYLEIGVREFRKLNT